MNTIKIVKVGIVGSRSRNSQEDKELIKSVLVSQIAKGINLKLVSGGCYKGADKFAEELARELGIGISIHPVEIESGSPRWVYREKAFARNTLIAEECDILIACWDKKSGGTKDTVDKVKNMKKPLIIL